MTEINLPPKTINAPLFIQIMDDDVQNSTLYLTEVENYFTNVNYAMYDAGYNSILVCLQRKKNLPPPKYSLNYQKMKVVYLTTLFTFIRFMLSHRKAIVYANGRYYKTLITGLLNRQAYFISHGNPLPGVENGLIKRTIKRFLYKISMFFFRKIRAISSEEMRILKEFKIPCKVEHIPLVIDHHFYSSKLVHSPILKKYSLPKDKPIILFFAMLSKRKNPYTFLQALNLLKEKGCSFEAVFVGGEKDLLAESGTGIQELIKEFNLESHCKYLGLLNSKQIVEIFNISRISVCTSYHEGNPLTVAQSAAAGLGLCLANIPGLREYRGVALIHEVGDAKKLAEDLNLMLINKKFCKERGLAAQKLVRKTRDSKVIKEKIVRFLTLR
ncbi:MAG: glycosyltransferase family 4 protein [Candidatus Woesearchaeota archaeon]